MKEYTIDIPIAGVISVTIESDLETCEDVEDAIRNDEIEIPISLDNIMNWIPLLDTDNIDWESFEAPTSIEVYG